FVMSDSKDSMVTYTKPLPVAVSPTGDSPGYITESDPEEDPEEDDEDPEEDPTDYPNNRDDEEEEEEDESSRDDADNEEEDKDKEEEEEEEEHLASADFVPPPACRTTTRMSIQDQTPIPFPYTVEVNRFLVISTPPPLLLTSYLSPLPQIPSPPLPVSSPLLVSPPPLPVSPTYPLGYRTAMIRFRVESPSTSHPLPLPSPITPPSGTPPILPIPLPTPLSHLLLPSTICIAGVSEVTLPSQKRLCIALGLRFEVGDSSSAPTARPTGGFRANYRFVATLDDEIKRDPKRKDTDEIHGRLDDAQDDRSLMSGQPNMLCRDRHAHARTARLMESEARLSREAWVQSMDASDTTRSEVRALWTIVLVQQTEIVDLRAADRRRQTQLTEALTLLRTLQTQMAVLQSQQTPARDPAHPDVPEEAGSSS
ncbi:hypothetical protein Tco_1153012, partial [Tanacetum coccineum]